MSGTPARTTGCAALLAVVLFLPAPAAAFVCTRAVDGNGDDTGPSLSWSTREIHYTVDPEGTYMIDLPDELRVLGASFDVWAQARLDAQHTTDLSFVDDPPSGRDYVGYDFRNPGQNENLLIFRDDGWLSAGQSCSTIALTTTTYSAVTGEIYDADIEFNSSCPDKIVFGVDIDGSSREMDLMNTAVHEIGHVLGLGHPDDPSMPSVMQMLCDQDTTTVLRPSMCSTAGAGETEKRDLAPDDIAGVVFKYPAGQPNGYQAPPACAAGLVGCGTCSDCETWMDVGFCAPPSTPSSKVNVTAVGSDPGGQGGCNCRSSEGSIVLLAPALLLLLRRRRARVVS